MLLKCYITKIYKTHLYKIHNIRYATFINIKQIIIYKIKQSEITIFILFIQIH